MLRLFMLASMNNLSILTLLICYSHTSLKVARKEGKGIADGEVDQGAKNVDKQFLVGIEQGIGNGGREIGVDHDVDLRRGAAQDGWNH